MNRLTLEFDSYPTLVQALQALMMGGQIQTQLTQVLTQLVALNKKADEILMTTEEALTAIKQLADLTTKIGTAVGSEGDTLQIVMTMVTKIVNDGVATGDIPQPVADALLATLAPVQAVSDNLDTHGAILTAILAKGQPVVPPIPIPDPVPPPPPPPDGV